MFASNGEITPPWGVPDGVSVNTSLSIAPACSHDLIACFSCGYVESFFTRPIRPADEIYNAKPHFSEQKCHGTELSLQLLGCLQVEMVRPTQVKVDPEY